MLKNVIKNRSRYIYLLIKPGKKLQQLLELEKQGEDNCFL